MRRQQLGVGSRLVGLLITLVVFSRTAAAAGSRFTVIQAPNAPYTTVYAVNNRHQIVGNYPLEEFGSSVSFIYKKGRFQPLPTLPGNITFGPSDINDFGDIVGSYNDGVSPAHGVLLRGRAFQFIDHPKADLLLGTRPQSINNRGVIVGEYITSDHLNHGFIFRHGRYSRFNVPGARGTTLNAINDKGQIVGQYHTLDANHNLHFTSFVYDHGRFFYLQHPQAVNGTIARDINNHGQVVGYYMDAAFVAHGFLYKHGTYATINVPGARDGTYAFSVNDQGSIVGYHNDPDYTQLGFMFQSRRKDLRW